MCGDAGRDRRVAVERSERSAPAGEAEAQRVAGAVRRLGDHRSGVADPRVVDRRREHLDLAPDLTGRAGRVSSGRRSAAPARTRRWRGRCARGVARGRELVAPQRVPPRLGRPRDERALVPVGLGRHPRPGRERREREQSRPTGRSSRARVNHADHPPRAPTRCLRSADRLPPCTGTGIAGARAGLARPLLRPGLRRRDPDPELGVLPRRATSATACGSVAAFVAVWWVWLATTLHANRFPEDTVGYRLVVARADVPRRARRDRRQRRRAANAEFDSVCYALLTLSVGVDLRPIEWVRADERCVRAPPGDRIRDRGGRSSRPRRRSPRPRRSSFWLLGPGRDDRPGDRPLRHRAAVGGASPARAARRAHDHHVWRGVREGRARRRQRLPGRHRRASRSRSSSCSCSRSGPATSTTSRPRAHRRNPHRRATWLGAHLLLHLGIVGVAVGVARFVTFHPGQDIPTIDVAAVAIPAGRRLPRVDRHQPHVASPAARPLDRGCGSRRSRASGRSSASPSGRRGSTPTGRSRPSSVVADRARRRRGASARRRRWCSPRTMLPVSCGAEAGCAPSRRGACAGR